MAGCYQAKKGALILACLLNIAIYIFVAAFAELISAGQTHPWTDPTIQHQLKIIILLTVALGLIFQLVGLLASITENSCLTLTYLSLTCLLAFAILIRGFWDFRNFKLYWSGAMWCAINAILAGAFYRALRGEVRERETARETGVGSVNAGGYDVI